MAKFEFEYTEIDGLLYPNIGIDGKAALDSLGKYGRLRLSYLHEQKPGMYRELLFTGELAEHICSDYLRHIPCRKMIHWNAFVFSTHCRGSPQGSPSVISTMRSAKR